MIQFPETAQTEWKIVADAANVERELRKRLELETQVERELEKLRVRHGAGLLFQQELDSDQTPALEMATLADYKSNPTSGPSDLIEGVLKAEGLCIMTGASGSGKSTLALQAVHSLMAGEKWLGQDVQPISGSVGIMSYDMDAAMVLDWMAGMPNVDPTKVSVVNAYKRGNPMGVPMMRAQIAVAWKNLGVEVVIIDSFSASFFGHDQNDAAATMSHYRDMKLFALTEVGAKALIVIAHSTEGGPHKIRGSSVHHDVADSIVGVEVDNKTQKRSVRMVKYRAARNQHQMNPVVVTAPDDVTHLVDLDLGEMTLAGMQLPIGAIAGAFALPDPTEEPDIDSDSEEDGDL